MVYQEVEIGGKKRPVKFGTNALRLFEQKTGINLLQALATPEQAAAFFTKLNFDQCILLTWCGLKDGARRANKDFDYTDADVADWMDDSPGALNEVLGKFTQSVSGAEDSKTSKSKKKGARSSK